MPHYALFALPVWGHCRPMLVLATRLVTLHPELHISLFLPDNLAELTQPALDQAGLDHAQKRRLEVVQYPIEFPEMTDNPNIPDEDDGRLQQWSELIGAAIADKFIRWSEESKVQPDVLLFDVLILSGTVGLIEGTYKPRCKPGAKIGMSCPVSLGMMASICRGLESPLPPAADKYIAAVERGTSSQDAYDASLEKFRPELGLDMYLWECDPNSSSATRKHMKSYQGILPLYTNDMIDFVLAVWPSPAALHPGTRVMEDGTYSKIIHIGPQMLPGWRGTSARPATTSAVDAFLDSRPARSVLYVATGTGYFPPTAAQVRILLDVLDEAGLGLCMAKGFGMAFDAESVEAVEKWCSGGKGVLVPWIDQMSVLRHKALAGFLTHGGSNSSQEAMLHQVPMIIWPGAWDQPYIANELSGIGIAQELVQVRTGHNVGRTTAKGVKILGTDEAVRAELLSALEKMKSEETRERCRVVGEAVVRDMEEGEAHAAMMRLGNL